MQEIGNREVFFIIVGTMLFVAIVSGIIVLIFRRIEKDE